MRSNTIMTQIQLPRFILVAFGLHNADAIVVSASTLSTQLRPLDKNLR